MILFLVKFTLGALTITLCFSVLLVLVYYWLKVIQGFCEGWSCVSLDEKEPTKDTILIPDCIVINSDGTMYEVYDDLNE